MKKKLCLLLAVVFLFVFCAGCHSPSTQKISRGEILYKEVEEGKHPNLTVNQLENGLRNINFKINIRELESRLEENGLQIHKSSASGLSHYIVLEPDTCWIQADYDEKDTNNLNSLLIKYQEKPSTDYFNKVIKAVVLTLDESITEDQIQKMMEQLDDLQGATPTVTTKSGVPYYDYRNDYTNKTIINKISISLQNKGYTYKCIYIHINYYSSDIN